MSNKRTVINKLFRIVFSDQAAVALDNFFCKETGLKPSHRRVWGLQVTLMPEEEEALLEPTPNDELAVPKVPQAQSSFVWQCVICFKNQNSERIEQCSRVVTHKKKNIVSIHCLGLFESYDSIKDIRREIK